jgi:hypothetical protein
MRQNQVFEIFFERIGWVSAHFRHFGFEDPAKRKGKMENCPGYGIV